MQAPTLTLLVAARNPAKALTIETLVHDNLSGRGAMAGVATVGVKIVTTLASVLEHKGQVDAIILLDLALEDATIDEVIEAIPQMPQPVIVVTDIIALEVHLRCEAKRAKVFCRVSHAALCEGILKLLAFSMKFKPAPE